MRSLLLLLIVLLGCSGAPRPHTESRIAHNTLTATQLAATGAPTLFEAIQRTKSLWVHGSRRVVSVFLDDQYFGTLLDLRYISTNSVSMVRYLRADEAAGFYGIRYPGPALQVMTHTGRR